ncbi:MAG: LptF/LptG family permease [Rickettsiales bacterium]
MHLTLFVYLCRNFLLSVLVATSGVASVFILSNLVDILKKTVRVSHEHNIGFLKIMSLVVSKVPYLLQESSPYIIFIGAILAFQKLSRKNEYTVLKSCGLSFWQFIMPFIFTGFLLGVLIVTIINPVSSIFLNHYNKQHAKLIGNDYMSFAFNDGKMWLVDKIQSSKEKRFVNSQSLNFENMKFGTTSFITLDQNFQFKERILSSSAKLIDDKWVLENVTVYTPRKKPSNIKSLILNTRLKTDDIKNNFLEPESISIWEMPYLITQLNKSGYSTLKHISFLYRLINKPLMICCLILIAASFSLKSGRHIKSSLLMIKGIFLALTAFLLAELSFLSATNGIVPPYASIVLSNITLLSISITSLYYSEEI